MTLQEALQAFLSERQPKTASLASLAVRSFQEWFLQTTGEPLSCTNWTTQDTREYIAYLTHTKHLKPKSINTYLSQLKAFASWCVDEGLMARDPIRKKIKGIKEQQHEIEVLDRNAENRLLRELEAASPLHRFIILFLLHTGLRNSELVGLELRDIELGEKKQTLAELLNTLPPPTTLRSGMLYVRSGKGSKAREIPLNNTARTVLLEYLHVRPNIESSRILISVKRREPIGVAGVEYACEKFRASVGVDLHPHMMRRTFGTKVARNHPIEVAADLLGHESVDVTRKYYLGEDKAKRLQAVESIED